jgi:hypothetical protein
VISDSPYEAGELALKPTAGIAAGILGGLVMLAIVQVLGPILGIGAGDVLGAIGTAVAPGGQTVLVGLVVHLVTAGVLGLMYSASQQRIPARGLVGVGVMFGLLVWIFGGLVAGWLMGEGVREALRSWSWLAACLGFGLTLAGMAVLAGRRTGTRALVRD